MAAPFSSSLWNDADSNRRLSHTANSIKAVHANPQFHRRPKSRDMACNMALEKLSRRSPDAFAVDHAVQAHKPVL
jgi:hypothetical protein